MVLVLTPSLLMVLVLTPPPLNTILAAAALFWPRGHERHGPGRGGDNPESGGPKTRLAPLELFPLL